MTKLQYFREEWYPVYILNDKVKGKYLLEIPEKKYQEYLRVLKEFKDIQDYLEDIIE